MNAYSGLFYFQGTAARSLSKPSSDDMGYQNASSYGKKSSFSYGYGVQAQRLTKSNILLGIGVAFENLRSKAGIDSIYTDIGGSKATGEVTLSNTFIILGPILGRMFSAGKFILDALVGFEYAISTDVSEKATLTSPFKSTFKLKKEDHPADLRPTATLNLSRNRVGLSAGYSWGTRNLYFYDNPFYIIKKAYARFLRVGLAYRII